MGKSRLNKRDKRILIGTAGWAIPRQEANHFPAEGSGLRRYGSVFNATEINSTFRKEHRPTTLARWAATTPEHFRFAIKIPKLISHELKLRCSEAEISRFADSIRPLESKMGPWLLQLPPSLAFNAKIANRFFRLLRKHYAGSVVCEPRHATWFEHAAEKLLEAFLIGRVATDPARIPTAAVPGASTEVVYFRLHGAPRMYYSSYDAAALTALARTVRQVNSAEVWCIFDNTASGAAAADALALRHLLNLSADTEH